MNKKRIVAMLLAAAMTMPILGEKVYASTVTLPNGQIVANFENYQGIKVLKKGNWAPSTHKMLQKLIDENGIKSSNYNPQHKPYAVFDWDNTSIYNDTGEAFYLYQLENLDMKLTPEQFSMIIRKDVPKTNFSDAYKNKAGQALNIDIIAEDLDNDYKYLYENYRGLKGTKSLREIKNTEQYKNFVAKARFLYAAIGDSFSPDVSYPWVTYFTTGMTKEEVMDVAEKSNDYNLCSQIGKKILTSSLVAPGKSGVVSVEVETGLRALKEQADLFKTLRENGIEVYICSASFTDIVKVFATYAKYGYNLPEENILAMDLERDANGVIMPEYRKGYDQTQNKGKTKNIERFLVSKYGAGPILVGGDSSGDVPMMTDFKDTKNVLILNRLKGSKLGDLCKEAASTLGKNNAKYLLQGRDENTGELRSSEKSIMFGKELSQAQLLK